MTEREGRGFAAMSEEERSEIARQGGIAAHQQGKAHEFTPEEAREAGRKGGHSVAKDREHMAAIGRKGGAKMGGNSEHMAAIGRKGGRAVSADKEHMRRIGRMGGQSRKKTRNGCGEGADS